MGDEYDVEPSAADLAAVEAEEPLVVAELAWFDAEIRMLDAIDRGSVTDLHWRRLRRAESAVIRETFALTRTPGTSRAA